MKNTRFRRIGTAFLAAVMLAAACITTAFAAEEVKSLPDSTSERTVTIHKYAPAQEGDQAGDGTELPDGVPGRDPLENVEFEIYRVPDGQNTSTTPTEEEIKAIQTPANLIKTVATVADGTASHSFGAGTANDGIYLVVEKEHEAVSEPAAPFYLQVPLTNPDGDGFIYDIHVYPKNNIEDGPKVNKDVTSLDNKHDTANMDEIVQWIVRAEVPSDLYYTLTDGTAAYARSYVLTDELSTQLDYKGNVSVKAADKDGTETDLIKGTDYTLDEPTTKSGGTLKIELTNAGMKKVIDAVGTTDSKGGIITGAEIRVYYDTYINNTAELEKDIENNVELAYTNSVGHVFEPIDVPTSGNEIPVVHTSGVNILKTDSADNSPLDGAKFKVAREVKAGETAEGTIWVDKKSVDIVYVEFYDSKEADVKVDTVTTDEEGKASVRGLKAGDYFLIETQAPDGYYLLEEPIKFTLNAGDHDRVIETLNVKNSSEFTLPKTGGMGTALITAAGVVVLAGAVTLIAASLRNKKKDA